VLKYPPQFTDPIWKNNEKFLKLSGTGIGKAFRDLEAASTSFDKECVALKQGKSDSAMMDHARDAVVTAIARAQAKVQSSWKKAKDYPDRTPKTYLASLREDLQKYDAAMKALTDADFTPPRIEAAIKKINDKRI
jgi:hypothetical protein